MTDFTSQFPVFRSPWGLLLRGAGALPKAAPSAAELKELHSLPDHLLHDMGLTRADLPALPAADGQARATTLETRGLLGFR